MNASFGYKLGYFLTRSARKTTFAAYDAIMNTGDAAAKLVKDVRAGGRRAVAEDGPVNHGRTILIVK